MHDHVESSMNRGVFAGMVFNPGTIISETMTWLLTPTDLMLIDQSSISGHWFDHPTKHGYGLLALGSASLVNHSATPNAELQWQLRDIGWIAVLRAAVQIATGAQIFLDYTKLNGTGSSM